jgi:uncharacterized repeat protein (TIGR03803 family)
MVNIKVATILGLMLVMAGFQRIPATASEKSLSHHLSPIKLAQYDVSTSAATYISQLAERLLVTFNFDDTIGKYSQASLIVGTDGNFYGTAYFGGTSNDGTVFRMTPDGQFTTLVNFNDTNGSSPAASLTLGTDGNFYGTTATGGTNNVGTVFRMTPDGQLTTLVNFNGTNGTVPLSSLTLGTDGNFYGTTQYGGTSNSNGTVFRVTPNGQLTTLVNFNYNNGSWPKAGLTLGADGNFYGTTAYGGAGGSGTVFRMTPGGQLTTLVDFNGINGLGPWANLILGTDGNFYSTTVAGGTEGKGTVFRMTSDGQLTTLVNFNGINGASPRAGLTLGINGNFYGTTYEGGTTNEGETSFLGTLFRMTPSGALTTLINFNSNTGTFPYASPTFGRDGKLYGTTSTGLYPYGGSV